MILVALQSIASAKKEIWWGLVCGCMLFHINRTWIFHYRCKFHDLLKEHKLFTLRMFFLFKIREKKILYYLQNDMGLLSILIPLLWFFYLQSKNFVHWLYLHQVKQLEHYKTDWNYFCAGAGGGLLLFRKLPPLLPGHDKEDKEPLETFFDMMGFGRVYDLWESNPFPKLLDAFIFLL